MSLDVARMVTQLAIPVVIKPFNLDTLLLAVQTAAARLH
jgi:hypothetical protein